ncbi:MAG: hypothetical protein AAGP08_04990 [Pseudomonadota bacterium]
MFEIIGVVVATLAVLAGIAYVVFRHEIQKEDRAHHRTLHDTAYGKDVHITQAADNAARAGRHRFDDLSNGGND